MALAGPPPCPGDGRAVPSTTEQCSPFRTARTAQATLEQPGTQGALVPILGPSGGGSAGDGDRSWPGDPGACHGHPTSLCLYRANSPVAGLCCTDHGCLLCQPVAAPGCPYCGDLLGRGKAQPLFCCISSKLCSVKSQHGTIPCPQHSHRNVNPKVIDCAFVLCLQSSLLCPCQGKAQRWLCTPCHSIECSCHSPSGH